MPLKLAVHGAAGRMGRQIVAAAASMPGVQVVAGLVRPGSPLLGQDVGLVAGVRALGVALSDEPDLSGADVVVDASVPAAAVEITRRAGQAGRPIVIATTGFSSEQLQSLREGARRAAVLVAPNLSLGVNLLAEILPSIVRALGADYDVEIVEAHHHHKKDAPSGTAIRLAEAVAQGRERPLAELATYGREGIAPRRSGEIGLHAVRAGGIVGEHHVLLVSEGEQIEIVHRAFSRDTFARGALRAAGYLAGRPPGWYTMKDVLS